MLADGGNFGFGSWVGAVKVCLWLLNWAGFGIDFGIGIAGWGKLLMIATGIGVEK